MANTKNKLTQIFTCWVYVVDIQQHLRFALVLCSSAELRNLRLLCCLLRNTLCDPHPPTHRFPPSAFQLTKVSSLAEVLGQPDDLWFVIIWISVVCGLLCRKETGKSNMLAGCLMLLPCHNNYKLGCPLSPVCCHVPSFRVLHHSVFVHGPADRKFQKGLE